MAGVIKKIRIPRENLPPTLTIDNSRVESFSISSVIVTTNAGNPVYEYSTDIDNTFAIGDFITITGIVDSASSDIFNLDNARIIDKPTDNTFQVQVASTTSTTYVSGGTVSKNNGLYVVRYRIISEDRNRTSHWSPQYTLSPAQVVANPGENIIENRVSDNLIFVSWKLPKDYRDKEKSEIGSFDVYVAWGTTTAGVGLYEYYSTVSGTSAVIAINPSAQKYQVAIQNRTYPIRRRVLELTIAETNPVNL
jgi:hypothetical protein